MPIHSAVGTLIRKTSLLRTVPTACGQAADKLTPFATLSHDRSSELAHERDFHHARCSERSYLFTMSDILQTSAQARTVRTPQLDRHRASSSGLAPHREHAIIISRTSKLDDERTPSWWSQTGSNRRPPACKAGALPTELWPHAGIGGPGKT